MQDTWKSYDQISGLEMLNANTSIARAMLVGRPEFSKDAKKLANDTTLMAAETLTRVLRAQEKLHFSQDELERLFKRKGELSMLELPI